MSSDTRSTAATTEAKWRSVLAVAQAALLYKQAEVLERAEDRLTKIADQQFAWNEFLYDRYKQKIVHCEDKMLAMACDTAPYAPKYDTAINRTQASVRTAFAEARQEVKDCASTWCVGATCATDRKLAIAEAAALVDAENAAVRIEDAKEEADKERIYSRLVNAANLGRGFMADARASAATSSQLWTNIAQAAGQSMAGNLQGLGDNVSRLINPYSINSQGNNSQGNNTASGSRIAADAPNDGINGIMAANGASRQSNQSFATQSAPDMTRNTPNDPMWENNHDTSAISNKG